MVKTPYIQPSSPLISTLANTYIIPLYGVLSLAHMEPLGFGLEDPKAGLGVIPLAHGIQSFRLSTCWNLKGDPWKGARLRATLEGLQSSFWVDIRQAARESP